MTQPGTVIVLQNGTALNVDGSQPQQPNVYFVQSPQQQQQLTAAAAPADDLGRFGRHLNRKITKISGDMLITWGFFAIIGGLMETVGIAVKVGDVTGSYFGSGYSLSEYSGFWCGALVITDVVAAGTAIVFALILLALTATEMTGIINLYDLCAASPYCGFFPPLMLASYSIMIGCSSLALIFGSILAVVTVIALLKGLCGGGNNVGIA